MVEGSKKHGMLDVEELWVSVHSERGVMLASQGCSAAECSAVTSIIPRNLGLQCSVRDTVREIHVMYTT